MRQSRRSFLKKLVIGSVFAVPVLKTALISKPKRSLGSEINEALKQDFKNNSRPYVAETNTVIFDDLPTTHPLKGYKFVLNSDWHRVKEAKSWHQQFQKRL